MADFYQNGVVTTLHNLAVVLPKSLKQSFYSFHRSALWHLFYRRSFWGIRRRRTSTYRQRINRRALLIRNCHRSGPSQ